MPHEPDYQLDIRGLGEPGRPDQPAGSHRHRPWLGIRFDCCGVYTRIYRDPESSGYLGRCPRCMREVRLRVAPGGTSSRFFTAL